MLLLVLMLFVNVDVAGGVVQTSATNSCNNNNPDFFVVVFSDMVLRILFPLFDVGLIDHPVKGNITDNVRSKEHSELARKIGTEANVLVKNQANVSKQR